MGKPEYRFNCIYPEDIGLLNYIIDNMVEITYGTFVKRVDGESLKLLKESLGYTRELKKNTGISLDSDWSVQFYKSKLATGEPVYILSHSGVEYIFY